MLSRLLLASSAALLGVSPVFAEAIVVTAHPSSFRDLEYGYSGQDRLDAARAMLADAIPAGSSVVAAHRVLAKAGARCADVAPDRLRCASNAFEAVDDHLHDVSWTVMVDHRDGAVTALSIDRASIGS